MSLPSRSHPPVSPHRVYSVREPPSLWTHPRQFFAHLITPYSAAERVGLERTQWFVAQGRGYFHEQSTQPQTLGYALADSPAALLAWIYEKLVRWTDAYPWEDDEGVPLCAIVAAGKLMRAR